MAEIEICPGCGRHCDLSEPQCAKGEEYHRTRKIPEKRYEKERRREMRMAHYRAADMNDKLIMSLLELGNMMRFLYEGKASQKRILIILNESETITQRDLTERLRIQPGSASEILSKLENAGLIIRTPNETDRRTTDVCLTDTGRELAAEALEQRQKRHEEMFSCLSEEKKQELLSLLENLCADWRLRYSENRTTHEHGQSHHGHHSDRGCRDGRRHHDGPHGQGGN